MKQNKIVIIIVGPTASGKTSLAIKIAQHFHTSIISADSRQCFRELNIGVARPSPEELNSVKHYFIGSHSIHENVTAQVFEDYALNAVAEIFEQNDVVVMAGGTGLYIKAFCEGLDAIPEIDAAIRLGIINNYKAYGLEWLQNEVQLFDPEFWTIAERQNPQRLMRALEVKMSTGTSIVQFRKGEKKLRPFKIVKLGLDLAKEKLHKNIDYRTDQMVVNGLIEEAVSLERYRHINALQTVGYKEVFDYFDEAYSLDGAIDKIKQHTRQYAKRQLTWFRKDNDIKWAAANVLLAEIDNYLLL